MRVTNEACYVTRKRLSGPIYLRWARYASKGHEHVQGIQKHNLWLRLTP